LALLTDPTAVDVLTLIARASAQSPNPDLVHPDLDDLARQAGVLAGEQGVLVYLADRIETAAPESAAELRAVAAVKTQELASVANNIREIVTTVARFRAQSAAEGAVVRAQAAAEQASLVLAGRPAAAIDPGSVPIVWPKVMPDSLAAGFVSAFSAARGFTSVPVKDVRFDRNTLRWSFFNDESGRPCASVNVNAASRQSGWWLEVTLEGADAELAVLVDACDWAPVSAQTRARVLEAAAFIGARQFASMASADLVAVGRSDADLHALSGELDVSGSAAVTAAVDAVRAEVQAAIDKLTADLTAAAAVVETTLEALPAVLPVPQSGAVPLELDAVHAAWRDAYPPVARLFTPRSGSGGPGVTQPRAYVAVTAAGDLAGRSAAAGVTGLDPDLAALLVAVSALRDAAEAAYQARVSLACYGTDALVDVAALDAAREAAGPLFDGAAGHVAAFSELLTPVPVLESANRDVATAVSVLRRISGTGGQSARGFG
jgi:hypothetical protein